MTASPKPTIIEATAPEAETLAQLMHDAFTDDFFTALFPLENGTGLSYYKRAWKGFCSQLGEGSPLPADVPEEMISKLGLKPVIATIRDGDRIVSGGLFWVVPDGASVSQEPPLKRWGQAIQGMDQDKVEGFFNGMSVQHSASMGTEAHVFVEVMMTHPEYRGRGYASAILDHAASIADKTDVACYLDADHAAVELYKKNLYEITKVAGKDSEMTPMRRPTRSERAAVKTE